MIEAAHISGGERRPLMVTYTPAHTTSRRQAEEAMEWERSSGGGD